MKDGNQEPGSSSQNVENITVEERLRIIEEVVAQKLKVDPSVAAAMTLEERVTRLEESITKDARIGNGPGDGPEEPSAVHGLGMTHGGSSPTASHRTFFWKS